MEIRPPDEPQNLAEWLWRLRRYESGIYVRIQNSEGRWVNASLAELDAKTWGVKVAGFLETGALPVRIKEPEEMQDADLQNP
jgi:hypothetical protein